MKLNIYTSIFLVLHLIGVGIDIALHGEEKSGQHNGTASLIGTAFAVWLLYKGGLFK